jgi:large subunit ribosomal protein L17
MRHRRSGKKLSRTREHRLALARNLTRSLFLSFEERNHIITTLQKAKFVRPFAEKLITLAKEKTLHNYRRGLAILRDEDAVKVLFDAIGPAYRERPGGYTRILRTSARRLGDKASQVYFGFVPTKADSEKGAGTEPPADARATDRGD